MLRLCLGVTLICLSAIGLWGKPLEALTLLRDGLAAAGAVFLIAGLWTPVMATVVALDQIWMALSIYPLHDQMFWIHLCLTVVALSVAMLGPGAWSIDARLFGRRRFDIDSHRG